MVKPTPSNEIIDYTWPGCSKGNAGVFVFVIPPVWLSTCSVLLSTCSVLKTEREEGYGLLQLRSLLSRIFLSQHRVLPPACLPPSTTSSIGALIQPETKTETTEPSLRIASPLCFVFLVWGTMLGSSNSAEV